MPKKTNPATVPTLPSWMDFLRPKDALWTRPTQADIDTIKSDGVVRRVPFLTELPAAQGGPEWKKFFDAYEGVDLDSPTNAVRTEGVDPLMLLGERIIAPNGWALVYRIRHSSAPGMLALDAHATQDDDYIASWFCPTIAPRIPVERDPIALKMVTASVILGAKRALATIMREYGNEAARTAAGDAGRVDFGGWKPTQQEFEVKLATNHAADIRGAPLYAGVTWGKSTDVRQSNLLFGD